MQFLTPDVVAKIAQTLGIASDAAQKAVSAGVPAILADFAGLVTNPAGAAQLSGTLNQQNPGMLSQIMDALGGPDQKAIADIGSSLLSALLGGSDLNALASAVSDVSGVNQNAGKTILGLLAPIVVGALGQRQRSAGLDSRGLANLLSSQKDRSLPPCRPASQTCWVHAACSMPLTAACAAAPKALRPRPARWRVP
jgi:hypothetical protein